MKAGKLVILGVTQEQHPERCRLFAQWQQFDWPILHDPINVLESSAVPIVVAIDEFGIVRDTRPQPATFAEMFLEQAFADDAGGDAPARIGPQQPIDARKLERTAKDKNTSTAWREYGDALALWGGETQVSAAIDAYGEAIELDAKDARSYFRRGVCARRRYETAERRDGDFQRAIDDWGAALALEPNQYIWRRRIEQYGPRLDKPYPFYDWVGEAEAAIRKRGETPIELPVRPGGAEIAHPSREFAAEKAAAENPDAEGKIARDAAGMIRAEVTVVPQRVKPGESARVHVVLRPNAKSAAHWNNEAEQLRLWIDPPEGTAVSARLVEAGEPPPMAASQEERTLDFEVKIPGDAREDVRVRTYALYHVCDDVGGQCQFLRLDIAVAVPVAK
ncbi:MAG: hypothetical protein WD875_16875 [Pirellulales bacterium]